jgi:hypothetical protein
MDGGIVLLQSSRRRESRCPARETSNNDDRQPFVAEVEDFLGEW